MRENWPQAIQSLAPRLPFPLFCFSRSRSGPGAHGLTALAGREFDSSGHPARITVMAALLYLPFCKFFPAVNAPAQLGVNLYSGWRGGRGGFCVQGGGSDTRRAFIIIGRPERSAYPISDRLPHAVARGEWQELWPLPASCKSLSLVASEAQECLNIGQTAARPRTIRRAVRPHLTFTPAGCLGLRGQPRARPVVQTIAASVGSSAASASRSRQHGDRL